jgi:hypothetical protein
MTTTSYASEAGISFRLALVQLQRRGFILRDGASRLLRMTS